MTLHRHTLVHGQCVLVACRPHLTIQLHAAISAERGRRASSLVSCLQIVDDAGDIILGLQT
jgi:hypothetical protein